MRIRERHPIFDRIKVFLILLGLLVLIWNLANIVHKRETTNKTATIETLLETALQPVGSTMYIWGGGWDDADNEAGGTSTRIGQSPQWKAFMKQQDANYDFEKHRFERENGLDCSGYVGWVLYNTFETKDGQSGYVTTSTDLAESLAQRGWGKLIHNPKTFMPGDIVSMEGHVWIVLGTCEDGSILLVHSSPPGVSVCGTPVPRKTEKTGNAEMENSKAIILAEDYMTNHHAKWQEKYPNRSVGENYVEDVVVFRWSENIMSDAERMQNLSAEEILERITGKGEIP